MALYDPSTGQWYDYNPSVFNPGQAPAYNGPEGGYDYSNATGPTYGESSLTPISAPSGVSTGVSSPTLVDPTQMNPQALAAQLLQSQFAEWESTYKPIEQELMNQLSFDNPNVLNTAIGKADTAAQGVSSSMAGILQRTNAARGISPTQQQDTVSNRILNLNTASNIASAENTTRANVRTQDDQILLGATPNLNVVKGAGG